MRKIKLFKTRLISWFLIWGGMLTGVILWQQGLIFPNKTDLGVLAGVPEIKETQEEGYLYEFNASTFKLLMGEDEGEPAFRLKQGAREIGINIKYKKSNIKNEATGEGLPTSSLPLDTLESPLIEGTEVVVDTSDEVVPIESNEGTAPEVDLDGGSTDQGLEGAVVTPTPVVTVVPSATATPAQLQYLEGLYWDTVEADVATPTPAESSFELDGMDESLSAMWDDLGIGQVWAQSSVVVMNDEGEPVAGYPDENLLVKPNLEGVTMSFQLNSPDDLPSLEMQLDDLIANASSDNQQVIFQTRTNRKAFLMRNPQLIDMNGQSVPVNMAVNLSPNLEVMKGQVSGRHGLQFELGEDFDAANASWPMFLEVEVMSMFHDRMLPARPVKKDFKATEELEFEIDVDSVEDEKVKQSLVSDNLPLLRFGLINSYGLTQELEVEVTDRVNGKVKLKMNLGQARVAAGIFDLLIQYDKDEAYIAETDFSWGVLAINPDQAIYQPGKTAELAMAVLDKNGQMVCDALLRLEITAPDGQVTVLTTDDGTIAVSDSCGVLITGVPDFSTSYQTTLEGEYQMVLSALTDEGSYVIEDKFEVKAGEPVYVRRVGPTRIYPLSVYSMQIEVYAGSYTGPIAVQELVPLDFKLESIRGEHEVEIRADGQYINWEGELTGDERLEFNYAFDTPNQSPALYFLGPVRINVLRDSAVDSASFSESLYEEQRRWQLAIDADGDGTNTVDPTTGTVETTGNTYTFTFTPAGTMNSGGFTIQVPSSGSPNWSAPQGSAGTAGYTTATGNTNATVADVIDEMDSATGWSAGSACSGTGGLSLDTTVYYETTGSIKCVNGNEGVGDVWYKNISSDDWSGYSQIGFWIRTSVAVSTTWSNFAYSNQANLVGPTTITWSTASANTWEYNVLTFPSTPPSAVLSYGFQVNHVNKLDSVTVNSDYLLLGPGVPTFSGAGPWTINVVLLDAAATDTISVVYGATGGASGVQNSSTEGIHTFTTQSRDTVAGTLTNIASSPTITLSAAPSGPTTDQVMRHGNWFSGEAEQYFYWAD